MNTNPDSGPGVVRKRRIVPTLMILLVLALLIIFLYPKQRVVGGLRGGPIGPGESAYREDYACTGIRYDYCPNYPDYGCDYLCFGFVSDRQCSIEVYEPLDGLRRTSTDCKGSFQPFWGLSDLLQASKYFLLGE